MLALLQAADGDAAPVRSEATDPDLVAAVPAFLDAPQEPSGEAVPARFAVGDRVTVARMAPAGHHRCPRYVRGAEGEVAAIRGASP